MKFEADIILFFQSVFNQPYSIIFFKVITYLGSVTGVVFLSVILFFKDKRILFFYLSSVLTGLLFNNIIKEIVSRERPYITYPEIQDRLTAMGKSMPSSHSMMIAIFFVFSMYIIDKYCTNKKSYKVLLILIDTLVMVLVLISRMVLGQHYITDIISGFSFGIAFSFIMLLICFRAKINFKKTF